MLKRKDSFFGLHFDFHARPDGNVIGATLKEEEIREICREIKPDFIQIDCKGHPGWTSYPSKLGNCMPEFKGDPLALWRKVTKEENVALYMHYSGIYECKYKESHPDEAQLYPDGRASDTVLTYGSYADELLIPQLRELAGDYGVDGVWVDGECWANVVDCNPRTLEKFQTDTGIDLKGDNPGLKESPYYDRYREYLRELFRDYLRHYVDTIHKDYPDFQIASNWAFTDHMPEKICANVDFLSGDVNPQNSFTSARYAARAIAQQNYTWDLMSWNFRSPTGGNPSLCPAKHVNQILQEAATVISTGGGYQDYIPQFRDGSPNMNQIRALKPLKKFMRERQDFCFKGKAVHQAAVLLSTYDRNRESRNLYTRNGYEKIMGLTSLMCDIGQSVEVVGEHTLDNHYNDYPMILVPELYAGLDEKTIEDLKNYALWGGSLVLVGSNTAHIFSEHGFPFAIEKCKKFKDSETFAGDNGHANVQTDAKNMLPYYFSMDGELFGGMLAPSKILAEKGETVAQIYEAQNKSGEPFAKIIPFGKGKVAVIGVDLGNQYISMTQFMHRKLMKAVADAMYEPIVKVEEAYGLLEIVCLKKDGKTMLQLVNGNGNHSNLNCATDDIIPPVVDIKLSIAIEKAPEKLVLQPENKPLEFEYKNGRAYFGIDRLNIHSVVEVTE